MKNYNIFIACFFILVIPVRKVNAQANTSLSNLVSPTQVNVHLLPNSTNTRNLGSSAKRWKDFHMDGIIWRGGYTWVAGDPLSNNTFLGQSSGNYLITNGQGGSNDNTFIGSYTGFSNTTGLANTFVGASAGCYNTTGTQNTFMGWDAGSANTTGGSNTFLGVWAGTRNTTGRENVMLGKVAGGFNNTGDYNVYIGNLSGYLGSAGSYNTFVGDSAGMENTASNNTMVGSKSGASNTSGYGNTFLGSRAAIDNTTGNYNTAIGYYSLDGNGAALGNTALGYSTGTLFVNGSYNTFVGYDADATAANFTNSTAIGRTSRITASNQVRIGNSAVTSIGGYVSWTDLPSDERFKKNIKDNVPGLSFINQLRTVTYNVDEKKIRNFLSEDKKQENLMESNSKEADMDQKAIEEKEKIIRTGFIAQQVEAAAKKIGYDFSGIDKPENESGMYGLRYSEFVVPLVKAVQELSKMNDDLKDQLAEQQKQISELKAMVATGAQNNDALKTITNAVLDQNIPNPVNNKTTIGYTLPAKFSTAQIKVSNNNGKIIKVVNITGTGKGSIQLDAASFSSGTYYYSLYVDGRLISSRSLIIQVTK